MGARLRAALAALALALSLSGCQAWLHLPQIGLHRPIVVGGQATIDAGNVTQVYPNLLAAHRSTHGSTFHALPALGVGSRFHTTGYKGKPVQEWVVVNRLVTSSHSASLLSGWPLVLQTSLPNGQLLLLFCRPV